MVAIDNILQKGKTLNREEVISLLELQDDNDISELLCAANTLRKEQIGEVYALRGVIEFSNYCENNCVYCAQREENHSLDRFRLTADEIIDITRHLINRGIKNIVLQSGEDSFFDNDIISYVIYSIKKMTGVTVTLNLGKRRFDEYRAWKIAGAAGYYFNHESTNSELYQLYRKNGGPENKKLHLKYIKDLGYKVGMGEIVGLPHQTTSDLADDLLFLKSIPVNTVAISPFTPLAFTPFQSYPPADIKLTLKAIAVARLLMPNIEIVSGAFLDRLAKNGRLTGLESGANVITLNFTKNYIKDLSHFRDCNCIKDFIYNEHTLLVANMNKSGLKII